MGVTKVAAMHALVVYESMFGNTRAIAEAVADGLREVGEADVYEVASAPTNAPDVDLVVVGGPTHAFGMTRSSTRQSAKEQAPDGVVVSEAGGVREWLHALPTATKHPCAAAFDTRVAPTRVPGSAAKGIAKRLRGKGFAVVVRPKTFWVSGTTGPLLDGELDQARAWGREVGRARISVGG